MQERKGLVTRRGVPVTLLGPEIKVGDSAPDFTALDNDLHPVRLSDFGGQVRVISVVPSLDTALCDIQTRKFNEAVGALSDDTLILTLSMDLPFAQKRWCGAAGVEKVKTLSDHRDADFGAKYGVLIKELRLLARAVFVLDRQNVIRYRQLVPETSQEIDFEAVMTFLKGIV